MQASSPVLDHPLSPLHPSSSIAGSSCGFTYATDSAASPQPSTSGPPQSMYLSALLQQRIYLFAGCFVSLTCSLPRSEGTNKMFPAAAAWNMSEQQPAASFASGESFQHSTAGEQNEVAMQAQTPHSQVPLHATHEWIMPSRFLYTLRSQCHLYSTFTDLLCLQVHQASRFAFQPGLALNRSNSAPDLRVVLAGPVNAVPQAVLLQQPHRFGGSSTAFALVPYKAPEVSFCLLKSCGYCQTQGARLITFETL